MRCSEFRPNEKTPVIFTCGRCASFYHEHDVLLEHLYWRHGTESHVCNQCNLRKWTFAIHKCFVLPKMSVTHNSKASMSSEDVFAKNLVLEKKYDYAFTDNRSMDRNEDAQSVVSNNSVESGDSQYFSERESRYCYCGKDVEGSEMIGCDNPKCILEWYHYKCVGIDTAPVGNWYCPECVKTF